MTIYEWLENEQGPTNFSRSAERVYYNENSYRLNELETYSYLANPSDSFGVVRGNIILRALENKETIEKLFKSYEKAKDKLSISLDEYMKNGLLNLPYLQFKGAKNFVPVFPSSVAAIYGEHFEKLGEMPYKRIFKQYEAMLIDPFDYYGYHVFISYFTNLVLIKKTEDVAAFLNYDANAIYFINDEGRLDAKLCLFDKGIRHPVLTHLTQRITKVVEAYFQNDREGVLEALLEGNLVSAELIHKIHKEDQKRMAKLIKKGGKE